MGQMVKRDVVAIYFAARDPRVPWYAKALAVIVAGYALSPIDLIPDCIPVLGYLDDVILVPAGILLVRRMIAPELLAEHRATADRAIDRPTSRTAAAVIMRTRHHRHGSGSTEGGDRSRGDEWWWRDRGICVHGFRGRVHDRGAIDRARTHQQPVPENLHVSRDPNAGKSNQGHDQV